MIGSFRFKVSFRRTVSRFQIVIQKSERNDSLPTCTSSTTSICFKHKTNLIPTGKQGRSVWCIARWASVVRPPLWSHMPWRSTDGTCSRPLSMLKSGGPSPNPTHRSWDSWKSIRESWWQGKYVTWKCVNSRKRLCAFKYLNMQVWHSLKWP